MILNTSSFFWPPMYFHNSYFRPCSGRGKKGDPEAAKRPTIISILPIPEIDEEALKMIKFDYCGKAGVKINQAWRSYEKRCKYIDNCGYAGSLLLLIAKNPL